MTLIIGMKYKEGIVLIGDRKVTEDPENHHFENKIEAYAKPPFNFLIGGAGIITLYKEFNRKIKNLSKFKMNNVKNTNLKESISIMSVINQLNQIGIPINNSEFNNNLYFYTADEFSDDCLNTMKPLLETGRILNPVNPLEILIALYEDKPLLFTLSPIGPSGFKNEGNYSAIGSGGPLIIPLLKEKYKENMELGDCVRLSTFLIKYAQKFGNAAVGIEDGRLPHIFVAEKDKCEEYHPTPVEIERILRETDEKIKKVEEALTF